MVDPRASTAKFYDLDPEPLNDVPFYIGRLPTPTARVLELGSGTGRVTVPLARHCASIYGIDHSDAMLRIGRAKLLAAGIENVRLELGDISSFNLEERFDFIIAPYRVLQNLESETQVQGLFSGIRQHLRSGGRSILNTFNVKGSREELLARWSIPEESLDWEMRTAEGRVACFVRRAGVQLDPLVLRPELIYRQFRGDALVEETVIQIAMRCYYPDELLSRIRAEGFRITGTFGGYGGEAYGKGPELVVEFEAEA